MTNALATGLDPAGSPTPYGAFRVRDLSSTVAARAAYLREVGVTSGDRVMLAGDNAETYVTTLLALAVLDTSVVLVHHRLPAGQRRAMADRAEVRWLVHDTDDDLGFPPGRVVPLSDLSAVTPLGDDHPAGGASDVESAAGHAWWSRRDAAILWSSGTTGPAKGVVKSGAALWDNTLRTIQGMGLRQDDVLAPLLPFSHQYGMSVVMLWWVLGCSLLVTPYHRLDRAVEDLIRHRATVVDASPPTYHTLLRLVGRRPGLRDELAGVRMWGVGGAPLPAPLAVDFRTTLGSPPLDGYGLTEVGNIAIATPDNPVGCGRPLPGIEVRVTGVDGWPAPAGALGEIEVRSPGLMTGYLGGAATDVGGGSVGGWFRTKDLGRLDQAGNLHVMGRKRAVHRLGHTLYPGSIERRAEHACGRPVAVLAVDDDRRGSSLVFFISDPDGRPAADWRERLCAALPHYEHPNQVRVLDRLPVNGNGKVDVERLRAELIPTDTSTASTKGGH